MRLQVADLYEFSDSAPPPMTMVGTPEIRNSSD